MPPLFGWFDLTGPKFDPSGAAQTMFDAIEGAGTTEEDLIEVMTSHTAKQRVEIRKRYKEKFARDLVEEIESDTSGSFCKTLTVLCQDPVEYRVECVRTLAKSDPSAVCEILCTADKDLLKSICDTHVKLHKTELEEYLTTEVGGEVAELLKAELTDKRNKYNTDVAVDPAAAAVDAKAIYDAGEGKWGTNEEKFVEIISSRTNAQLVAINEAYKKLRNKELEAAITSEIGGGLRDTLIAIVKSAINQTQFFVDRLHTFMEGAGTDDDGLIRVLVTRQEIDLIQIALAFQIKYKMKLSFAISTECSGDYKTCLLSILGKLL